MDESRRIDALRAEVDDFDRAMLMATAFHEPKDLETRRKELRARLRNDPQAPAQPTGPRQWTPEEMKAAAARLMAKTWTSKPMPS